MIHFIVIKWKNHKFYTKRNMQEPPFSQIQSISRNSWELNQNVKVFFIHFRFEQIHGIVTQKKS
jgi:hypothetical protein